MDNENVTGPDNPEPVWKRRGFESDEALEKAFVSTKEDLKAYKSKMRELEAKAAKVDEYEQRQAALEASQMSELDKAKKALDEMNARILGYENTVKAKERELTYERLASSKLSGVPEAEAKLLRRLYDAEALRGFETPEELKERLDAVDADWQASKPVPKEEPASPFKRPPSPGSVVAPPGKQATLDESTFDDLNRRLSKGPSKKK